ncbi:MAG: DUF2185 domain-containing protein [Methylacidiphilales bacterium]|nr:DUF2185 domain-containing protein [Candidatus Methylacidiphilales bacterium]
MNNGLMKSAAIVCREVALDGAPILHAERSEPQDEADSGWQFLCGGSNEDWSAAQVWAVDEVLKREPSLSQFIDLPVGTVLSRESATDEWKIE